MEFKDRIDDIEHPIVREALRLMGIDFPLEISTFADIPSQTGLGSSSAFAVGLLNTLYALQGKMVTKGNLAAKAAELEIDVLERKIGKQDHYSAAYGNINVFGFHKNGHVSLDPVFYRPEIFETFDRLKEQGKIQNLGVSVEKVEEALKAIEYDNVATVQIIFNLFRQRPSELFFREAERKNIGIIARVPLASGLLTGKFSSDTKFEKDDHRNFNRDGKAFDKGETFSGIDYNLGLKAVDELKAIFPDTNNLAPIALQWILEYNPVSCIIPGASKMEHVVSNLSVYEKPSLSFDQISKMNDVYEKYIKKEVHQKW